MGLTLCFALCFGAVFAYISGSPFVLEDIFGLSPQLFGVLFGVNAVGLVAVSQLSGRLVSSVGPQRLLMIGVASIATAGVGLMVTVLAHGGLAAVEICFFAVISSFGLVAPNATALALAPYPHVAGSASALIGLTQFCVGAAVAPLVGLAGNHSAVPTATVILALVLTAVVVLAFSLRRIAIPERAPVVY